MKRRIMLSDRKNQYCENDYATQSNLRIQCDPYQITSDICFTELEPKKKKKSVCMETQKTPKCKSNLQKEKMELEESTFLTSDHTRKLQSSIQ